MKKLFCLILAGILIMSAAWAEEIDLSGLTFEELDALRDRCMLEMMKRDVWQEVTVPQGVYQVGVQIPAGTWTVYCHNGISALVNWGDTLTPNHEDIEINYETGRYGWGRVYNPHYRNYKEYYDGSQISYTFTVREGEWIIIEDSPAVFTPGSPTPSFSFK